VRIGRPVKVWLLAGVTLMLAACAPRDRVSQVPTPSPPPAQAPAEGVVPCTYAASLASDPGAATQLALPGGTVHQTWALRNDGTCDWTGVTAVLASPSELGTAEGIPVPAAAAQTSIELALDLTAPGEVGEYGGEWRLRAPDGTLFGPSLSAQVSVQYPTPAFPPSQYAVTTQAGCVLDLAFLDDVTLVDGTLVHPSEPLEKVWRVQNTGTCDWPEGSSIVYRAGDVIVASSAGPIPATRSGEITDIRVNLTAPAQAGDYIGWWRLQSADGALFGISLYVMITVSGPAWSPGDAGSPPSTTAPAPSAVPTLAPSAVPTLAPSATPTPADTPYTPFIHNISYHSREIFLDGQARGNRANIFAKVGDSITEDSAFLFPIGDGNYALRDYDYLQPVVNYFLAARVRGGNSFNNQSLAAVWGWSTFDLLNPDKVADTCPGVTPLECEYSVIKPALAIIMIGTNDAIPHYDLGGFEGNIRQIIEASIDRGVIPVMSTVPYDQFTDVQPYNQIIVAMAVEYDVPWMDFYEAVWDLENHGISPDGVHPSVPANNDPANFTSGNLRYGQTVRNLLVLHVLDGMWRQVLAY
jgi:hypothetical protein